MQVHMQNAENLSPEQMREFLNSSGMEFTGRGRAEIYAWTERVLIAQEFGRRGKRERGLIRAFAEKATGKSPSQMTRLIRSYLDTGRVAAKAHPRAPVHTPNTAANAAPLAEGDRAAEPLSGAGTRCRS